MSVRSPNDADPPAAAVPRGRRAATTEAARQARPQAAESVIVLGTGAGGREALRRFFSALAADSGLAFVVVPAAPEVEAEKLAAELTAATSLPVSVPLSGKCDLRADRVWVLPADCALKPIDGTLHVAPAESASAGRGAIDLVFRAVAEVYGPQAVAIVLSGVDGDGAIGIKRVRECGGLVIAQDPTEAASGDMPRAAINAGVVDWVLTAEAMPAHLLAYFERESQLRLSVDGCNEAGPLGRAIGESPAALDELLAFVQGRTGLDISNYSSQALLGRVGRRMRVDGIDDLRTYLECLRTRPGEVAALVQDLHLSLSNFFRDPEAFEELERQMPALFASKAMNERVRVWVVGCATGEEAYSIAILLREYAYRNPVVPVLQIIATDIDDQALAVARLGVYPESIAADVSEERLKQFFIKESRQYRVRPELREMILFSQHDVVKVRPFSRMDLVSCRHLLAGSSAAAKEEALENFEYALVAGGRLFLGPDEEAGDGFFVVNKPHGIFANRRRQPGGSRLLKELPPALRQQTPPLALLPGPSSAGAGLPSVAPLSLWQTASLPSALPASWGESHAILVEHLSLRNREKHLRSLSGLLEQQVTARASAIRILHDIIMAANQSQSTSAALQFALARFGPVGPWTVGHAWLRAENGDEFYSGRIWHVAPEAGGDPAIAAFREATERVHLAYDDPIVGPLCASPEPLWIDHVERLSYPGRASPSNYGLVSAMALGVRCEQTVVAVLEWYSREAAEPNESLMEICLSVGFELGHVFERKRMERDLAMIADEEQRRMGHEMHDGLGQQISGIGMLAASLADRLQAEGHPCADRALRLRDAIEEAKRQSRALTKGLMPIEVAPEGLTHALGELAARTRETFELECTFSSCDPLPPFDSFTSTHVYRIACEAVHNAVKHSQAKRVSIQLDNQHGPRLVVSDDGRGLGSHAGETPRGEGLKIMRYRAHLIGATFAVESAPHGGAVVICRLPG